LLKVKVRNGRKVLRLLDLDGPDSVVCFAVGPVDGWVLVLAGAMFESTVDVEWMLATLSEAFGEAQHFTNHRVSDAFSWEVWREGRAVRRWSAWGGDEGKATKAEKVLGLGTMSSGFVRMVGEEDVQTVAGAWSVDPMELGDRNDVPLLGRLFVITVG
jgi:hypothetical protein